MATITPRLEVVAKGEDDNGHNRHSPPETLIRAKGVVSSVADVVKIAREAAVRDAEFLRLELLEQEQSDGSP